MCVRKPSQKYGSARNDRTLITSFIFIVLDFVFVVVVCNGEENFDFACERRTVNLLCDEDSFLEVSDALYGYDWGDTAPRLACTVTQYLTIEEGELCAADKSTEIVSRICNGKVKCTVDASNRVFGDPCYGTVKYLRVNYTCVRNLTTVIPPEFSTAALTTITEKGIESVTEGKHLGAEAATLRPLATLTAIPLIVGVVIFLFIKRRAKNTMPEPKTTTKEHASENYYLSPNVVISAHGDHKKTVDFETSEPAYSNNAYEVVTPSQSDIWNPDNQIYENHYFPLDGTQLKQENENEYISIEQTNR